MVANFTYLLYHIKCMQTNETSEILKIQWNIENVVTIIKHLEMTQILALNNPLSLYPVKPNLIFNEIRVMLVFLGIFEIPHLHMNLSCFRTNTLGCFWCNG